jgi:hypothetical protein
MRPGQFQPGQSGNPAGRPKTSVLTELLRKAASKTVATPNGRVAGKRLIAKMVLEGLTTGKVQFPDDDKPSIIGVKDWIDFVKWFYQYLEPAVIPHEVKLTEANIKAYIGLSPEDWDKSD